MAAFKEPSDNLAGRQQPLTPVGTSVSVARFVQPITDADATGTIGVIGRLPHRCIPLWATVHTTGQGTSGSVTIGLDNGSGAISAAAKDGGKWFDATAVVSAGLTHATLGVVEPNEHGRNILAQLTNEGDKIAGTLTLDVAYINA